MKDIEQAKVALRKLLDGRIPNGVVNGSHGLAVEFKDWANKARSLLNRQKVKLDDINALIAKWRTF